MLHRYFGDSRSQLVHGDRGPLLGVGPVYAPSPVPREGKLRAEKSEQSKSRLRVERKQPTETRRSNVGRRQSLNPPGELRSLYFQLLLKPAISVETFQTRRPLERNYTTRAGGHHMHSN